MCEEMRKTARQVCADASTQQEMQHGGYMVASVEALIEQVERIARREGAAQPAVVEVT